MINKESYGFNTFVATRVGEIQNATDVSEWFWIKSNLNIADILTRGANPSELHAESDWQYGPDFLKLPLHEWPISNDCSVTELPERNKIILAVKEKPESSQVIDIKRFSNYNRLIRTTARILNIKTSKPNYSLSYIRDTVTIAGLESAKIYWVRDCQNSIKSELNNSIIGKGQYRNLNVKK